MTIAEMKAALSEYGANARRKQAVAMTKGDARECEYYAGMALAYATSLQIVEAFEEAGGNK